MRKVLLPIAAAAIAGSLASGAGAVTFIDVISGNDPYPNALNITIGDNEIITPALFKCETSGSLCITSDDEPALSYNNNFSVELSLTNDDGEFIGGTFSFNDQGEDLLYPRFFTLKAGDEFAVFEIGLDDFDGTSLSGIEFSTGLAVLEDFDLFEKELSHISFYDTRLGGPGPGPQPVPLPAAAWLLITALGGLGFLSKRRRHA